MPALHFLIATFLINFDLQILLSPVWETQCLAQGPWQLELNNNFLKKDYTLKIISEHTDRHSVS